MKTIRREKLTSETRALANNPGSGYLYCGRPSPFGNPFTVEQYGRTVAVNKFGSETMNDPSFREAFLAAARKQWRPGFGIVLLCYCKAGEYCHTDGLVAYLIAKTAEKAGK